ncbi:MAG: zinc-binding dehydrogenase, partial [Eubacteriales bacterium]
QTALNMPDNPYAAPGYSFKYIGGDATYIIIPAIVMERGCLLTYTGDVFFRGSLGEPMSCIIGGFHSCYHTAGSKNYEHKMGIVEGGNMAIFAGAGPMGLGTIDYAIHNPRKPKTLVVTDIDDARLQRAASILTVEDAAKNGVELHYVNTNGVPDADNYLRGFTNGKGFDDIFVLAPVKPVVEQADRLLAYDGCLNFFAGPTNTEFSALFNFYNVHYSATHICGSSGGNAYDLIEALEMLSEGTINPAAMITHVGGLNAVAETTLNLPKIPGGKKLIYNHIDMPLTAIEDFALSDDPMIRELGRIVARHNGLWNGEAEKYLLAHAKAI